MIFALLQVPASSSGGFEFGPFGSALGGTVVGALISLAVFRGRLDVYAAKFEALEKRLTEQRQDDKERLEESLRLMRQSFEQQCAGLSRGVDNVTSKFELWTAEARSTLGKGLHDSARREEFLLELVLGIARKQGVRHRFSDALAHASDSEEDKG